MMKTYRVEIDALGTEWWWNENGLLHRDDDKPAVIWSGGTKEWRKNGKLHRDGDQPAVVNADGTREWYKNGIRYYPEQIDDCDGKIVEIEGKRYRLIAE